MTTHEVIRLSFAGIAAILYGLAAGCFSMGHPAIGGLLIGVASSITTAAVLAGDDEDDDYGRTVGRCG